MFKKIAVCALAALMGVFVFAGCRNNSGGGDGSSINVRVVAPLIYNYEDVLQLRPNDKQALLTKEIMEGFSKEYPEIEVNLTQSDWGDALNSSLISDLNNRGPSAPDILVGEQYVHSYIEDKVFAELDLETGLDGQPLASDLITQCDAVAKMDGKYYAIPIATGTYGLNINLSMLRECKIIDAENAVNPAWRTAVEPFVAAAESEGFTVSDASELNPLEPTTWEDLMVICRFIRAFYDKEVTVGGEGYTGNSGSSRGGMMIEKRSGESNWQAMPFLRTAGGDFVDSEGVVAVGDSKNEKAFRMMHELYLTAGTSAIISASSDYLTQFFGSYGAYGVFAQEIVTRAYLYDFADEDVLAVKLPTYADGGVYSNSMVGSLYMSVNANRTANLESSLTFIKYLLSEEVQLRIVELDGRVPVRQSLLNSDKIKQLSNYEKLKPFLDMYNEWDFEGQLVGFSRNPVEIWAAWDLFVGTLYSENFNLAEALAECQTNMLAAQNTRA